MPLVLMQVNEALLFMLSIRSAMRPPHPRLASSGGNRLPCIGLIKMRKQRRGKGGRALVPLILGDRRDQRSGVRDQRSAAGIKEILHAGEVRVQGEGAARLRREWA